MCDHGPGEGAMKRPATALKWVRIGLACGFFLLAGVAVLCDASGYAVAALCAATVALARVVPK